MQLLKRPGRQIVSAICSIYANIWLLFFKRLCTYTLGNKQLHWAANCTHPGSTLCDHEKKSESHNKLITGPQPWTNKKCTICFGRVADSLHRNRKVPGSNTRPDKHRLFLQRSSRFSSVPPGKRRNTSSIVAVAPLLRSARTSGQRHCLQKLQNAGRMEMRPRG